MAKRKKYTRKKNNYNDDLCALIAIEVGGRSNRTIKKYLKAIKKVILRQLELNGKIQFENFGTFYVSERRSGERKFNNYHTGKDIIIYSKKGNIIRFKPSYSLSYAVSHNFEMLTYSQAEKIKKEEEKKKNYADMMNLAEANRTANRARVKGKENGETNNQEN